MENFSEIASSGTDVVKFQDQSVLDPFREPSLNDTFVGSGFTRFYSRDSLSNSTGTYHFEYERELLPKVHDLSTLFCELETSIVKVVDGKELPIIAEDGVTICNYFTDCMFSKIRVSLNQSSAYESPPMRFHMVQLSRLFCNDRPITGVGLDILSKSDDEKNPETSNPNINPAAVLRSNDFYSIPSKHVRIVYPDEDEDRINDRNRTWEEMQQDQSANDRAADAGNNGQSGQDASSPPKPDRNTLVSERVWTLGALTYGLMTSNQFIPFNTSIAIELVKESDDFLLHCVGASSKGEARQYKVKIHFVGLYMKYYLLNDELYGKFKKYYSQGMRTKLYYLKPYTNSNVIEQGCSSYNKDIHFRGRKLVKLIICFLNSARHDGDPEYACNVYRQPPNIRHASIKQGTRDSLELTPTVLRTPSTSLLEKLYFDHCCNLQNLGAETERNTVSFEHFKRSAFIMTLNCVAGGVLQSNMLPILTQGEIHLQLLMDKPLEKALYCYQLGYTISCLSLAPGQPCLTSDSLSYERN